MGGFEDLQSEEPSEESSSCSEELTRDGYSKGDGFVVDDDEAVDDEVEEEEKPKRKVTTKPRQKRVLENVFVTATEAMTLDCSQELSEEEYLL